VRRRRGPWESNGRRVAPDPYEYVVHSGDFALKYSLPDAESLLAVDAVSLIVKARVHAVAFGWRGGDAMPWTTLSVSVEQVYKGSAPEGSELVAMEEGGQVPLATVLADPSMNLSAAAFSPEQRTSGLYVDRLFDSRSAQVGDVVILALQPNPNEQWSDRFAVVGGPLGRFTRQPSGDYLRAGNVETLGWRPSISEADL